MYYGWKPYVSVAKRKSMAEREAKRMSKSGSPLSPVAIDGRTIASTFWGKSWCENLERYSDYENRLPRGRTYARNGSVIDLRIEAGKVQALVMGSSLYKTNITVAAVPSKQWQEISADCAGSIDTLVELLQGKLSDAVMSRICRPANGLFPAPKELKFECSCPDWADMCKHVAAVLYGVGARLDKQPELLFTLRKVDAQALVAGASAGGMDMALSQRKPGKAKVLDAGDASLAGLFGIDLGSTAEAATPVDPTVPKRTTGRAKKSAAKKPALAQAKPAARGSKAGKGTKKNETEKEAEKETEKETAPAIALRKVARKRAARAKKGASEKAASS